jgi:tetratricopeptide (TPR) repeat protein
VVLFQWEDLNAEYDEAIRAFEQSLALYRQLDDRRCIARCLVDLGWAQFDRNRLSRNLAGAAASFDESLALSRALDDPIGAGWSLIGLGRIAQTLDDGEHAAEMFEQGLAQHRRAGNHLGMAAALDGLGLLRQSRGQYVEAMQFFEQAVDVRRAIGAQSGLQIALQRLAVLLGAGNDQRRSAVLMGESLTLSQRMGNPWDIANGLLTFGGLAGGMGLPERGARLFVAGEAMMEARGMAVPEAYRGLYTRAVAGVRRALGEEAFATAWAAGYALTLDEAIAEALQLAAPV